ncbi:MAG: hypothetical protein AVDCRST_MAG62-512 [uncultured Sphingomonas sp.]|uniref:Cytochrome c oxidase subunit IV bacterial aa3 type domain-containing protein n=1 Tax=uncultured Sphingomonas sp. TaxID=158754 RepID=A0A6J4T0L4_9SPHN|nr:MAG: hypothetical protein AVDCRST_MAG62-512 [uncultured Sphingomonas sp.]
MADQVNENGGGQVDFEHHARDYSRMISMLKWGAIGSFIIAILVLIIISS